MASALLLVSSLMVGVVPNALVVLLLLLKFPQLLLIALVSAAVYYFGPVMSSSLWFWMLGTKDSSDASFFFVVWCSVATEASRYAVCTWVLRAESEFRRHHQTLKYTRAPHNKLVPLALAVGAGFAMMQSTIAAGLVANAEVMLTWRDQGTETGAWMTEGADVVSWFDITSCPQMPKIAVVAVQCLLLSVCQYVWSYWMMHAAATFQDRKIVDGSVTRRSSERRALRDETDGVDLEPVQPPLEVSPSSQVDSQSDPAQVIEPQRLTTMSIKEGIQLLAAAVGSHALYRLISLAASDAFVWDFSASSWSTNAARGCSVTVPVQATLVVVTVVAAIVTYRHQESSVA